MTIGIGNNGGYTIDHSSELSYKDKVIIIICCAIGGVVLIFILILLYYFLKKKKVEEDPVYSNKDFAAKLN